MKKLYCVLEQKLGDEEAVPRLGRCSEQKSEVGTRVVPAWEIRDTGERQSRVERRIEEGGGGGLNSPRV
jgi:hypothetical protein